MGGPSVQALSRGDLPRSGPGHRSSGHPTYPFVSPACHGQHRILVLHEDLVDLLPPVSREALFTHHLGDLCIAFQQLERNPVAGIGRGDTIGHEPAYAVQHLTVVVADFGNIGLVDYLPPGQPVHHVDQFAQALVSGGDHGHDGYPQGCLQHLGLDGHPLARGHVNHIEPDDHARWEGQEFGHQV